MLEMITDAARRHKVTMKDVKQACEGHLHLQLAQVDTWYRLARSLASKATKERALALGRPQQLVPRRPPTHAPKVVRLPRPSPLPPQSHSPTSARRRRSAAVWRAVPAAQQ